MQKLLSNTQIGTIVFLQNKPFLATCPIPADSGPIPAGMTVFLQIPVHSCGFQSIPVEYDPIPVDSSPFLRIPVE